MITEIYENGPFLVNSYLLFEGKTSLVIDPGKGSASLIDQIRKKVAAPEAILITHPHIDHVEGIPLLKEAFPDIPVYMSFEAADHLSEIPLQARMFGIPAPGKIICDRKLPVSGSLSLGLFQIEYVSTPGHCPGSLTYYIGGALFTGDLLFQGSVGRTDFPGGDYSLLCESILTLYNYPDETPVYPGHGGQTTIGEEKKFNAYIRP
ncbi:MAG: MBL fold metallo-hydrolase [Spirochaetota bacterium]